MDIKTNIADDKATIALAGWLDTETAPQLGEAVSGLPENVTGLVLDFAELEYISSAGIRQIVAAHKAVKGSFSLINVSPEILEVLNMTGVAKRIDIA